MKTTKIVILLLLIPLFLLSAVTVEEVEKNLMCTCGCTMPLYTCENQTAQNMRSEIRRMIDRGMDKDQIIASFVSRYGETILSAPTKKGFNLVAWLTPFLALFAVTGFLYKAIRRWSAIAATQPEETLPPDEEKKYMEKLKKELENIEEGDVG